MKITLQKIGGLCLGIFWGVNSLAQDISSNSLFSQYHLTPFLTNPAMVANHSYFQGILNYRQKELAAGASFNTPMFTFTAPLRQKNQENNWGGIGIAYLNDNAVDFLKTNGILASFAYKFHLSKSYLNLGIQAGYLQRRIDLTGLSTALQFQNDQFLGNIDNGEVLEGRKSFVSFSTGAFWGMEDEKGQKAFAGVSLMNFNQPDVAFAGNNADKLPIGLQLIAGARVWQNERFSITPNARFAQSNQNNQLALGAWWRMYFAEKTDKSVIKEGNFGIGTWYNTTDALILSFEFNQPNFLIAFSYDFPTSNAIQNTQNSAFELTAVLKLRSSKSKSEKDSDNDGVPDSQDSCPDIPGLKELNGCPDSDNDGIPDAYDNCPNEKGLKEFGGCPDSDGDQLPDKEDECPTVAGSKSTKGCPDRDNDGIADLNDQCPELPGLAINKGCPQYTQLKKDELKILEQAKYVHFEAGTSVIDKTSYSILDLVVEVMRNYPNDVLLLDGHTDSDGDEAKNQELGLQRAEAVKNYLVSKGLASENIQTASHGETQPIADNNTFEGKSLNRRVEMKVLKK